MDEIEQTQNSAPKGRGRGGVPLLPEGMWESLTHSDRKDSSTDNFNNRMEMPTEFGGFGKGRGRGRGLAMGGGIKRNAKGVDWDCPSCGNLNWSWRASCNKCNASKPLPVLQTENEIRDGVGGGFNERQERASAATVEIGEDGFDDFGRRVKKDIGKKTEKELAALARLQQNYGYLLNGDIVSAFKNQQSDVKNDNKDGDADQEKKRKGNIQFEDAINDNSKHRKRDRDDDKNRRNNDDDSERESYRNHSGRDRDDRDKDYTGRDRDRYRDFSGRDRERDEKDRDYSKSKDRPRDRGNRDYDRGRNDSGRYRR